MFTEQKNKTILVAPLNWGLGHASRMIPLIDKFIADGNNVVLASDGDARTFLGTCYKELECLSLPSLDIKYARKALMPFYILIQVPKIIKWMKQDNRALAKIIEQREIDIVVSDNRWGFSHPMVYSIFVTHQVNIKLPSCLHWFEYPLYLSQKLMIRKFDQIWVPDYASHNRNLSGDLSHKRIIKNTKFIGLLSRFSKPKPTGDPGLVYDVAVVLSGIESQRSILKSLLIKQFSKSSLRFIFVGGEVDKSILLVEQLNNNIQYLPFCGTDKLETIINQSKLVVCRPGYTSAMDMIRLRKASVMIPTPGQTEQEYLAKWFSAQKWFTIVKQHDIYTMTDDFLEQCVSLVPPREDVLENDAIIAKDFYV